MKLLLDTHAFLWWVDDRPRLTARARKAIADPANEVLVSSVSGFEIVVKAAAGRLRLPAKPSRFITEQLALNSFEALSMTLAHALRAGELPSLHRDPFDRLLVAQALVENATLVTGDRMLKRYRPKVLW